MNRLRLGMSVARCLGCAVIAALFVFWSTAPALAVVKTDNFTGAFDYGGEPTNANGTFTAGPVGIWEGSWNMANLAGGSYDADFTDAGALHVDDNNITNVGWEGGRSTAPLLWTSVPGNQDFTATVKITAQTAGFWSSAGLIARAANSPTPPGPSGGSPDLNADENFITATTFRTDSANPSSGNTLNKRIENGAQLNDNNFAIGPALGEALPNWVRLEKIGTVYRTWASLDGVNYQFQSRVTPTAGNALEDTSVAKQVGITYMNYGGQAGSTTFDDFNLDIHDPIPAPGAPNLSTSPLTLTVPIGTLIQQLVNDSTGGEGPMAWARVADAGNPARPATNPPLSSMIPGAQGGAFLPPLPPAPPFGSSYFRWDTTGWKTGTYKYTISATNDWGQASNGVLLTINLIPEPATLTLAAIGVIGACGLVRRRRC
jgi:PEP-CTERM motif